MTKPSSDSDGVKKTSAYERWELPALLEQEKIARLKLPTLAEIEALRQDAYDEGFKNGEKDGFAEGLAKGLKNGETRIQQQLKTLIDEFSKPIKAQEERIEKILLYLTLTLTRTLIKRELSIDSSGVAVLVEQILAEIDTQEQKIKISLNPVDINTVSHYLAEQHGQETRYQLIEDKKINQGGCIVRSEASYVDAQIETRLKRLIDQVYERCDMTPVEHSATLMNSSNASVVATTDKISPASQAGSDQAAHIKKLDLNAMPFFDAQEGSSTV